MIHKRILRFLTGEEGPTAVEYAVMLAMILWACVGAVALMGTATADSFTDTSDRIGAAISGS